MVYEIGGVASQSQRAGKGEDFDLMATVGIFNKDLSMESLWEIGTASVRQHSMNDTSEPEFPIPIF